MSEKQIFVGREEELKQFKQVLENPQGQAILVIGQSGMGKTLLVNKMAEIAASHPDLKCGCVRYEVTPTDSVDSTMALMMDNAFDAAQVTEGSFAGTERRLDQWKALLNIINLGDLVLSLRRDPAKNTREQFLERLSLISKKMPENGRAIFIIDPEKYMQKESDQSWAIVVEQLPEKIKFVFAQRSEDALVDSETFNQLKNMVRIPENLLDVLEESAVDELIQLESANIKYPISEIKKVISGYKGHPYAVGAALELLKAGTKLEELPKHNKPVGFAKAQWNKICEKGDDAIALFEAYAVLEVGVPDEITRYVSELNSTTLKRLQNDSYLKGLLRDEGEGKRIYHSILADYILKQMNEDEKKKYHLRAVEIYREKLKKAKEEKTKPDELAATRLPEHVLVAEGKDTFIDVFIGECGKCLVTLGALDTFLALSKRALTIVKTGSENKAILLSNLGLIYRKRGDLDKAEEMHKKALEIDEKLGNLERMTSNYSNLSIIYNTRGDWGKAEEVFDKRLKIDEKLGRGTLDGIEESLAVAEKMGDKEKIAAIYNVLGLVYKRLGRLYPAEEMHNRALEIYKKLDRLGGMANQYGNLGNIYQILGDWVKAEEIHNKILEIHTRLGNQEGMAREYCHLGLIYQSRGELDKAEEMFKKSLQIEGKLGHLEGMANDYSNLGLVYKKRGDIKKAKEYWVKARDLFAKIGIPYEVKEVQWWIDEAETD